MAPIPSSVDTESNAIILDLQRRQKDLSEFQLGRLRGCRESIAVQQRFANEMREDLDFFERQTETLGVICDDLERSTDRAAVRGLVEEFNAFAARIRKDMRAAVLESKKAIDQLSRSRRDELLKSTGSAKDVVDEKSTEDKLMQASNNVTDALRRTIGVMQGELERSVLSHQVLEKSTVTLLSTSSQHDSLTAVMDTSKQLITALEKADWLDRLLIFAALAFFVLVVLFIIKQRILDRGLRVALWWTRFLPTHPKEIVPSIVDVPAPLETIEHTLSSLATTLEETLSSVPTSISDTLISVATAVLDSSELPTPLASSILDVEVPTVAIEQFAPPSPKHVEL